MPLWLIKTIVNSGKLIGISPETLPDNWIVNQKVLDMIITQIQQLLG